ncbi:hypothetical protein LCGC14_1136310 [marine sediment metagenome]|uniref:Uncharacterized protein n=1 Tax=marine sediment metagenome TaxID=412755 RepID=A0A0F9LZQ0_9ZZZZ
MVMDASGTLRQLEPDAEQIVDGESQVASRPLSPLIEIARPDQRTTPLPVLARAALPTAETIAEQQAIQGLFGQPVVRVDRHVSTDEEWRTLVRWDVPVGLTGDLHQISLLSNLDANTRYRLFLANVDQDLPEDRQTSTPLTLDWRRTVVPGGTSVWIEVRSTDGTEITVDGVITGTVR